MKTKERIQKARDLQATANHHLSLAYLQIVKDCLKKNSTLDYFVDCMGSQHFVDKSGETVDLGYYTKNYMSCEPTRPSFKELLDFLLEFEDRVVLPNNQDIVKL